MSEHIIARKTYIGIWALLMLFTALTFGLSYLDLGQWSAVIAVVIAATKATIIRQATGLGLFQSQDSPPLQP